jgi:hypothetical protein
MYEGYPAAFGANQWITLHDMSRNAVQRVQTFVYPDNSALTLFL